MGQPIDHDELDALLKGCGSSWNAGQAHGLLCSRVSLAGADGASRWIAQVLGDATSDLAQRAECEEMLDALCATTWQQLVDRQSEFNLLLPDDQDPASVRTEVMAQWCEGYLHGLVAEKHSEDLKKRLAEEPLADIIKDMLEITRATVGDDDDNNNIDNDLAELVEYLRVAVQLTYEELADFRKLDDPDQPDASDTLH
jgi:yecA family protein